LTGAQVAVGRPSGGNCSVYSGWGDKSEVPFCHGIRAPFPNDCSDNEPFMVSLSKPAFLITKLVKSLFRSPGASFAPPIVPPGIFPRDFPTPQLGKKIWSYFIQIRYLVM